MHRSLVYALAGFLLAAAGVGPAPLPADVVPCPLFRPGAVLQAEAPIPVWGTAGPGESVSVSLGDATRETTANGAGRWRVHFPAMPRSKDPVRLRIDGDPPIEVEPVWIGDVFLVAGHLPPVTNNDGDPGSPSPSATVFTVRPDGALIPATRLEEEGAPPPHPLPAALARDLRERSGHPIGLVVLSAPGTLDSWIPSDLLAELPAAAPILRHYEQRGLAEAVDRRRQSEQERLEAWRRAGQALPLEPEDLPSSPGAGRRWDLAPSSRHNAMAAPLAALPVRGLFWVHGHDEESAGRAAQYGDLLPAALAGFRRLLNREDLPIQVLQAGSQRFRRLDDRAAAELRDLQWATQTNRHNRVVVTLDLDPAPPALDLATRMGDAMVSQLRGDREGVSPSPRDIQPRGGSILVHFQDTAGRLQSTTSTVQGFALRDGGRRWVWADAEIEGDHVRVHAPGVGAPTAVRYAWRDQPPRGASLINARGLPAPSFRSDDAPLVTRAEVSPGSLRRHSLVSEQYIEDPRLPRILVIGDSVAIGQIPTLRRHFDGKANIVVGNHHRGAGFYTTAGALKDDTLARFLADTGPYDVIQFNMGIHEFASQREPEKTAVGYGQRLRAIVKVLRGHAPGTRLIWCSSTGSHADGLIDRFPLYLSAARAYNAEAARIMEELGVPVTDLFGYTQPEVKKYIGGDLIHLRPDVKKEITDFMAVNLQTALESQ